MVITMFIHTTPRRHVNLIRQALTLRSTAIIRRRRWRSLHRLQWSCSGNWQSWKIRYGLQKVNKVKKLRSRNNSEFTSSAEKKSPATPTKTQLIMVTTMSTRTTSRRNANQTPPVSIQRNTVIIPKAHPKSSSNQNRKLSWKNKSSGFISSAEKKSPATPTKTQLIMVTTMYTRTTSRRNANQTPPASILKNTVIIQKVYPKSSSSQNRKLSWKSKSSGFISSAEKK